MAGFNKVILIGNLTRNPELRYTPSGTPVASFGLATSRRFKQGDDLKEEVCFIDTSCSANRRNIAGSISARAMGSLSTDVFNSVGGRPKTARNAVSTKWWRRA